MTLLAVFGLGLRLFDGGALTLRVIGFLALITFLPTYRRFALALAPIVLLATAQNGSLESLGLSIMATAAGMVLFFAARRWPQSAFGRRPILFLLVGFTLLILCASVTPHANRYYGLMWALVGTWAAYLWFIAYALTDRTASLQSDGTLELATFHPLWGSTNVPFPKGANYLRRIEASSPEQLAIVQLKGVKLLTWAILLALTYKLLFQSFFRGYLHIPTAEDALAASVRHMPFAWRVRWESQLLSFFESILSISVLGHQIIACCRMAGFNALRNTYRPLSATTVAEFFNRFYYYFKELLVDFFFFPAFLRYWKGHRRIRLVFANFASACFGNAFYHFTRDWPLIRDQGLRAAIANFQVFAFYCVILAVGISVSQSRKRGPRREGFFRGQLVPITGVMFFYSLLDIFGATHRNYPLVEHLRFLASLFFIHF